MKKYIKIGNVCYCQAKHILFKNWDIINQYETRWVPWLITKSKNEIDNAKEISMIRYYIYKLTWL